MRYTVEHIQAEAEDIEWELLSTSYQNLKTDLIFLCPEKHKVFISYGEWRKKPICPVCQSNEYKQMDNTAPAPRKKKGVYRILAIDQSSRMNGFAVFDNKKLITYGKYESTKDNALERMVDIGDWLASLLRKYSPDQVGFEDTQYNPQAGMGHEVFRLLSQVMGAMMYIVAREDIKIETVRIPTWRGHCKIKGSVRSQQKKSAQERVKTWYDISVTDDESDAICMGKYFVDKYLEEEKVIIGEWI